MMDCGASLSFIYCLESWRTGGGELEVESPTVLNYLFEQIIVVEDKLKEEVESEKNF